MIYFLLNSFSEDDFVIVEISSAPDPETLLKTMQVFQKVIARSALCSSIPSSFPINPALPETHLSVLTSLHSHLHSTISKMEAIQQQTLSQLQQELRKIKTCMVSLPWESFNKLSQILPSYIQQPDVELSTTSNSSPYSLFAEEVTSPLLPFSPLESSSSSFGSLTSILDEVISSDVDSTKQALTEPSLEEITVAPLLSDDAAQSPTSTTREKPSTSSLHRSSLKRKVLSKSSDYYTKRAKITVISSSVTETLIERNLPSSPPALLQSSIELFTENTDDIIASDNEEYPTPTDADQDLQTQDVRPLPAIQKDQSSRTVSPLFSDETAKTPTSPTSEKSSTSSLHRSSLKRKVLSKSSDYYTKKAKITVTSSSVTKTLIEKNLPSSSPVSPQSSIEFFTENTDDIVASGEEEHSTSTTSDISIPEQKQSLIKEEELHPFANKQKTTTSIEESATHIKEAFLPIIQPSSPENRYYFVTLTFITKKKCLTINYRKKISSIYSFLIFLKQVRQGISICSRYKCARYIPEIPQQQSSNTLDLLKALYASIVRNHYFFVKNYGSLSTKAQQQVDSLLNLLNQKYYVAVQEEDFNFLEKADNCSHHLALKTFTETPPQPILNQFNFAWYTLKKKAQSKSLWIIHTLISFDKFQQLRSISTNARNLLNRVEEARKETSFWLDCNDGSIKLPYLPKHPITSHQGFQILQAIITYNKKCFNEHIALLEKEIPDTFWKNRPFYKETIKTLDELDKCLREWKDSLKSQCSNIPLAETAHTTTSISRKTTQEINPQQPSQDTSFVQSSPIFITIVPNTSFNSFTIRLCKRAIIKNFKASCKIAKDLTDSSSYLCQEAISEDIPISSKDPLVITKTLFTALCISAFGYRQKTASSEKMSALTPDLIHSLFDSLKALDQKYCQILNNPYDPSPEIYHPDLQTIITRGNILSLLTAQAVTYSFTYTFLSISFKKQHFSILERTYSHSHFRYLFKLIYDQLCHTLKDIIKLILSSEVSALTGTISDPYFLELLCTKGITLSDQFTRQETLLLCHKMLKKLQTQILTDALFKKKSNTCNIIQKNLSITLTWLDAHIAHQPLPTIPLPSDLYSLPITVIQISKKPRSAYQILHQKLWFQEKNSQLESLKTCSKKIYKQLPHLFNHPLQPIIYQNHTFLDFSFLIPVIYRTIEYEMLQIKKIILIALQRSLSYPSIQKPAKTGFRFLLKCQNLIETKWQEIYPNTSIPTLEDLSENIKPLLPFTSQDVKLLEADPIFLKYRINLTEILTYSDDSDQEKMPFSDDTTPKTSSK